MLGLNPYLILLLIACLFILVFGGLSFLRREGLSIQFALEAVVLTLLLVGGSWLLNIQLSPFVFLLILYLITMRSRLAVDVANILCRQGRYRLAFRVYDLALTWWPDLASRLIVLTNRGAAELRCGQVEAAVATLESVLAIEERPRLGLKYEAACRYNLGYAYEKGGREAMAVAQYNEVIDLLPGSLYAKAAQSALERRKKKDA